MSFFSRLFGRKPDPISDPGQVPDAFPRIAEVFDEIGAEAIGCAPSHWTNVVLTLSIDGGRVTPFLSNHRGEPGKAKASRRLVQLSEALFQLMASSGDRWTRAELRYDQAGGAWQFKSSFAYD